MQTEKPDNNGCGKEKGTLPGSCAPMAFPYVPVQERNPPRYNRTEALQTGTLFPGLNLPFKEGVARPNRDNAIDVYMSEDYMDVLAEGEWQKVFSERPEPLTREEKREWLNQMDGVALGSDAFFPFDDNVERAHRSGVKYIAQPGGSIRDDLVIEACNKYGIAMYFTGMRLFHH